MYYIISLTKTKQKLIIIISKLKIIIFPMIDVAQFASTGYNEIYSCGLLGGNPD